MARSSPPSPAYTETQLKRYFERIALPVSIQDQLLSLSRYHDDLPPSLPPDKQLAILTTLQQHQLTHVPFENLSLHYSPHRTISLDVSDLYGKIVERRRGGYCMENNCFFAAVLRGLNFTVYSGGGRVSNSAQGRAGSGYSGWYVT